MRRSSAVAVILAYVAASAAAQNLVFDGDFDHGISPWTQGAGTWTYDAVNGFFAAGSAQVVAAAGTTASLRQCVDLTSVSGHPVTVVSWIYPQNHTLGVQVRLRLFTSSNCTTGQILPPPEIAADPSVANQWNQVGTIVDLPASTRSGRIELRVVNISAVTPVTRFDDVSIRRSLVEDGGFDQTLGNEWTASKGTWSTTAGIPNFGFPAPTARGVVSSDADPKALLNQCIDMSGLAKPFDFFCGARLYVESDEIVDDALLRYDYYSSSNCSGGFINGDAFFPTLIRIEWNALLATCQAPVGTNSMRVRVGLTGERAGNRIFVDNIFAVGGGELIFADGFESGDTSRWSSSLP